MRIVRLPFSRMMFFHGGLPKKLMKEMIDLFPEDAKIVGFGNDSSANVDYMFVESSGFDEVVPGGQLPDGRVFFTRKVDNGVVSDFCEKIEWCDPRITRAAPPNCAHFWKTYTGLNSSDTYCTNCGAKK